MARINVKDRLPSIAGRAYKTNIGAALFKGDGEWTGYDNVRVHPEWWEEEFPTPEDPKELANVILINAIVNLNKEHAQSLVRELCDRFGLLPTPQQISNKARIGQSMIVKADFIDGADFVINKLKGDS